MKATIHGDHPMWFQKLFPHHFGDHPMWFQKLFLHHFGDHPMWFQKSFKIMRFFGWWVCASLRMFRLCSVVHLPRFVSKSARRWIEKCVFWKLWHPLKLKFGTVCVTLSFTSLGDTPISGYKAHFLPRQVDDINAENWLWMLKGLKWKRVPCKQ